MSKSAIKALKAAEEIMKSAGVTVELVGYITDANLRKNWRNADALAALIINSAANAFQTENSETFADNFFDDMAEAVERYISANLDDWNQKSTAFMNLTCKAELARLMNEMSRNIAFEQKKSAAREEAHAEALEINELVDIAVQRAACYSNLDAATPNAINHAVNFIRNSLCDLMRYNPRFIVKMMISVRRLSDLARKEAAVKYEAMMQRCAAAGSEAYNEIPF